MLICFLRFLEYINFSSIKIGPNMKTALQEKLIFSKFLGLYTNKKILVIEFISVLINPYNINKLITFSYYFRYKFLRCSKSFYITLKDIKAYSVKFE